MIYYFYFLPIFKLQEHAKVVTINGTKYVLHQLSYKSTVYISEPLADPDKYRLGKQIGRTKDGMQIYQVEGDDTRVVMQGFMFLLEVYKKDSAK